MWKILAALRQERWLIPTILLVAAIAHGVNMFDYPSYREDEGTYMSQAWAIETEGKLAPYTYWYDHAPAGWIFIAIWNMVTGGDIFRAGLAVNWGRIFMLVLHVIATYLLYRIAKNMTGKKSAAVISSLLFALLPLGIVFQRRVYLDNIMTFWLLVSLFFLTSSRRLFYTLLSALTFAISALSKESAIAFWPIMIIAAAWQAHPEQKRFATIGWLATSFFVMSIYPLFALLKGEMFPSGTLLGGTSEHVSLWNAIVFQYNRNGAKSFFLSANSSFVYALKTTWVKYGVAFLGLGLIASIANIFYYKRKWPLIASLLSWIYVIFTLRGQVLDWYVIPLVPLMSLNIGIAYVLIREKFENNPVALKKYIYTSSMVLASIILFYFFTNVHVFSYDQTINQVEAVQWVKDSLNSNSYNLTKKSIMMIDNYAFPDLNPHVTNILDTNIQYYWKADTDPVIRYGLLKNDWNNIDYLLFTPALVISIYNDYLPIIQNAYKNSHVVKRFHDNIPVEGYPDGYPVEIREVNNKDGVIQYGWQAYKQQFITVDGRVLDPYNNNRTTSEGQSYAMLRAVLVWQGDRPTFDKVLNWTQSHLKHSNNNLYSWLYAKSAGGGFAVQDTATASDADEDIALALLLAYKQWGDPKYLTLGRNLLADIWKHEVVNVKGRYYLTSSADSSPTTLNPSYFSPASYRIFAEADTAHPWGQLVSDTYKTIGEVSKRGTSGLPPNWVILNSNGTLSSAAYKYADADRFGYDAFRLLWRVALDRVWFNSPESLDYLNSLKGFFTNEWTTEGRISAVYYLNGQSASSYTDISTDVGALSVLYITKPEMAIDLYSEYLWEQYKNGFWGEKTNYYNQNWAWFGSALYANNLPNIWANNINPLPASTPK